MECPLPPTADWEVPHLHRRHPHELHWKDAEDAGSGVLPPGSGRSGLGLGRALRRLYPHLVDDPCCLQCGATPCPHDHAEEQRVRLVDLQFVRDLARERRGLLQQLTQLRARLEQVEVAGRMGVAEKLLSTQELSHYKTLEKDWEREKNSMTEDLERLRYLNKDHLKELAKCQKRAEKYEMLSKRVELLEDENKQLKHENKNSQSLISRQVQDIAKLESENRSLTKNLDTKHTEVRKLRVELYDASQDVTKLGAQVQGQEDTVRQYNQNLSELQQRLHAQQSEYQKLKSETDERIMEMADNISALEASVVSSTKASDGLEQLVCRLREELEDLRARLTSDRRFRQFVNIKREVTHLRERNECLAHLCVNNPPSMPVMTHSGRVCASGSHVKLTAEMTLEAADLRPTKSAVLRRPKSSRSFVCH